MIKGTTPKLVRDGRSGPDISGICGHKGLVDHRPFIPAGFGVARCLNFTVCGE